MIERDGQKCLKCGVTTDLTYDHVLPACFGGSLTQINGQTLCRPCNEEKGENYVDYRPIQPPRILLRKGLSRDQEILAIHWEKRLRGG